MAIGVTMNTIKKGLLLEDMVIQLLAYFSQAIERLELPCNGRRCELADLVLICEEVC